MRESKDAYYYKIDGLQVPPKSLPGAVHNKINQYIDTIPRFSESLNRHFDKKEYDDFVEDLNEVLFLLREVYAERLEGEGEQIRRAVRTGGARQVKKRVRPFVANLLSLSIEMQKAQTLGPREKQTIVEHAVERPAKEEPRAVAFGDAGNAGKPDSPRTILAVDDRPEILASLTQGLKGRYKVLGVTSGAAVFKVLEALGGNPPDLFLLDIDMPDMDGYSLAKALRETKGHADTPIIFLTGNASRDHVIGALQVGGNDFIVKPASHEVLLEKIDKYLTQ